MSILTTYLKTKLREERKNKRLLNIEIQIKRLNNTFLLTRPKNKIKQNKITTKQHRQIIEVIALWLLVIFKLIVHAKSFYLSYNWIYSFFNLSSSLYWMVSFFFIIYFLFTCIYNYGSLIYFLMVLNSIAGFYFTSVLSASYWIIFPIFGNFPTSIFICITEILESK